jgi:NADPH-dependent curcumin reductase CurA
MTVNNLSIVLAERPTDDIVPGTTFAQKITPAPTPADLKDGEILVEALYLSLDPAMRGWLQGNAAPLPHQTNYNLFSTLFLS